MFAGTILSDAQAAITAAGLAMPLAVCHITGSGVNIMDCCDGLLWVRMATLTPTDGSGQPLRAARIDFDIPAWQFTFELGVLWCHQNMNEDGSMIDPALETTFAQRDDAYRLALYTALTQTVPAHLKANCGHGYSLSPWAPVGPDGGCSGGILVVNVIATALAG